MKKFASMTLAVILTLAMLLTLVACGGSDAAKEAAPKSAPEPVVEATTTPEPAPPECEHEWEDATCDAPVTCSLCGETLGEPLGHDFAGGNFQEPAVCTRCGEVGEILTPGAVEYGLNLITETGVAHRYVTVTMGDNGILPVIGEVTLVEVRTAESYEGIDAEEGYEFIIAYVTVKIADENARNYGFDFIDLLIDYYTYDPSLSAKALDMGSPDSCAVVSLGQISDHGKESEFVVLGGEQSFGWSGPQSNRAATLDITYAVHVPIDYDGIIIAFASGRILWSIDGYDLEYSKYVLDDVVAGDIIDSDTVFFRLRG